MKRVTMIALVILTVMLTGCKEKYEIAFVGSTSSTNYLENDDILSALDTIVDQEGMKYLTYNVDDFSNDNLKTVIDDGIENGVELFVFNGDEFSEAFSNVHYQYSDKFFVLFNGNVDNSFEIENNAFVNNYEYSQIGFISGYSMVADGFTKFSYISDSETSEREKELIGFVAGINYAANELEVEIEDILVHYAQEGIETDLSNYGVFLSGNVLKEELEVITNNETKFILSSQTEEVSKSDVLASTYKDYFTTLYNVYEGIFNSNEANLKFLSKVNTSDFGLDFTLQSYNKVNPVLYEEIKRKVIENSLEVPKDYEDLITFFANELISNPWYPDFEQNK